MYKGGEGLAREISSCSVGTVGMEVCQKFNMGRVANSYPVISVTTRHFIKFLVFLSIYDHRLVGHFFDAAVWL